MTQTGTTQDFTGSLSVSRVLPAPAAEVFAAWTDPDLLRQWMSPPGTIVSAVEADARPGGAFRLVMAGQGQEIEHTGEYVEVSPPRRLSFTWRSPFTGGADSLVTVTLEPRGEAETHLLLVHERLPSAAAASHQHGWGGLLQRLEEVLTP
jgi:uncharacterized protein YndB with AHSA1/START domain